MQLITEKKEVPFRGPTSSEDFNKFIDDIHYDLTQIFTLAEEHNLKIPENLNIILNENYFLKQKATQLQALLDNIKTNIDSINAGGNKSITHYFGSADNATPTACVIDSGHGVAYKAIQQEVSKLYLKRDDTIIVPQVLLDNIFLYESLQPFDDITADLTAYEVSDANIHKAFDGNDKDIWQRRVEDETGLVNSIYGVIKIVLPKNIVNHMRVNSITLNPSPEFSMSILDIKWKDVSNWQSLDTYPTTTSGSDKVPKEIAEASDMKFVFPRQSMTELLIYFKQPYWQDAAGKRVFVYGFRGIEVSYARFDESSNSKIRVRFDHPQGGTFSKIVSAEPIYAEGGIGASSVSVTALLYEEGSETPRAFDSPISTSTVYVEVSMGCDSFGTSPLLSGLKIEYTSI
jgi:hypothetical protein